MAEDKLEDFIKKRVEQHQTPTDPALLWQKIQVKQEEKKKPKRRFLIFWWLGSALLMGITLFSFFYPNANKNSQDASNASDQYATTLSNTTLTDSCLAIGSSLEPILGSELKSLSTSTTLSQGEESLDINSAANPADMEKLPEVEDKVITTSLLKPTTSITTTTKKSAALPSGTLGKTNANSSINPSNKNLLPSQAPTILANQENELSFTPTHQMLSPPSPLSLGEKKPNEPNGYNLQNHANQVQARRVCERLPVVAMQVVHSTHNSNRRPLLQQPIQDLSLLEKPWRFSIGAAVAYGQARRTLSSRTASLEEYLQTREDTETPLDAVRGNLDIQFQHHSGLYLKSGLEYEQINERFEAYLEWDSIEVEANQILAITVARDGSSTETRGNGDVSTTFWTQQKIYNHYRSIDIPLVIGYHSAKKSRQLGWFVEGGASANIWFSAAGKIISTDNQLLLLNDHATMLKTKTGISLLGAIGLTYQLTNSISIWANPAVKYRLGSVISEQNVVDQKYLNIAFNVGVRHHL